MMDEPHHQPETVMDGFNKVFIKKKTYQLNT